MTPQEAHQNLVDAIIKAPPMIAAFELRGGPNTDLFNGAGMVSEILDLLEERTEKESGSMWKMNSPLLRRVASDWAIRFGTVAKKLQEGQRFAPTEIKSSHTDNNLDPALYNVLADGWHHQPIAQPLAPMPDA